MAQTRRILMLTGWRGTGKDTYAAQLAGSGTDYRWLCYCKDDIAYEITKSDTWKFFACAAELKREVIAHYQLALQFPEIKTEAGLLLYLESRKNDSDLLLVNGQRISYRKLLIDHGAMRRAQSISYWIEKINCCESNDIIVTDWRFPNELYWIDGHMTQCQVRTVRLYRSAVPIPPWEEPSEHSLDSMYTDVLLVPSEADYEQCCRLLPHYREYRKMDM